MHKFGLIALSALLCAPAATASAGELRLSIANGRVTIVAQDVSVRQILDEWGRVGETKVVGAERLTGPAITIELHDVPEGRALEALLRSASGYIAKPRSGTVGASTYDRIMIMQPSQAPPRSAAVPAFNQRPQPQVVMPNVVIDDDGEPTGNGIMPPGSVPQQQQQQFPGQPPLPPGMQPGQTMPTLTRPGMLPAPAPTVPGNPYQANPQQQQQQQQPPNIRPPGVPGPGGPGGGES